MGGHEMRVLFLLLGWSILVAVVLRAIAVAYTNRDVAARAASWGLPLIGAALFALGASTRPSLVWLWFGTVAWALVLGFRAGWAAARRGTWHRAGRSD